MKKVWLITGAGKGFGLEITKAVLAEGHRVIAAVRKGMTELSQALGEPAGLLVVEMDVTNELQVEAAVAAGLAKFGQIDVLVNNAGYGLISAVEEATDAEVKKQFETNVFGVLNVSRAVLPFMRQRKTGRLINISALFAFGTIPGWGIYSATKFAIEGLTEGLALELAPLGIYATVVEPGMFTTNFLDGGSFAQSNHVIEDYQATAGQIRALTSQFNGTQPGDPKKLALALLQLAAAEHPPVHLPLGKDCIDFYEQHKASREKEMSEWKVLSNSTDH